MTVLDNKKLSHFDQLKKLIRESDELLIVSPFLSTDIYALLEGLSAAKHIKSITLVTVLAAFDQAITQPRILCNFIAFCVRNNIAYRLYIDEALHSKIYLFKKVNKPCYAVVTSANFTSKGLKENHETGVTITDSDTLYNLERNSVESCLELSSDDIAIVNAAAKLHIKQNGNKTFTPPRFNPWSLLATDTDSDGPPLYPDRNLYIKPIGCTQEPYIAHEPLSSRIHFSKKSQVYALVTY